MIYPELLSPGDKIMIVSPSGKIDKQTVEEAEETLSSWGFEPVRGKNCLNQCGRFAGTDEERLSDFTEALMNKEIKAILCSRGGYGAIRLVDKIPLDLIRDNPKWLIGFSDISLIHALFNRAGVVSLHAPMAKQLAENRSEHSTAYLNEILVSDNINYIINPHFLNRRGVTKGRLFGGNLSVIEGLRSTQIDIPDDGIILFIEDIGEEPYRVERMMYNLYLSGVLKNLKGLIVGQFTDYEEDESLGRTVYQMIADLVSGYDYPVCFNFPVGHVVDNYPLLEGGEIKFDVAVHGVIVSQKVTIDDSF